MNGEVCCILGVCCPPMSLQQQQALEKELVADGFSAEYAEKTAIWILSKFDLAPHGSLTEFKSVIGKMARAKKDG